MAKSAITMQTTFLGIMGMLDSKFSPNDFKKLEKEQRDWKKKPSGEVKARESAEKESEFFEGEWELIEREKRAWGEYEKARGRN